jgi:hypothetical protein
MRFIAVYLCVLASKNGKEICGLKIERLFLMGFSKYLFSLTSGSKAQLIEVPKAQRIGEPKPSE